MQFPGSFGDGFNFRGPRRDFDLPSVPEFRMPRLPELRWPWPPPSEVPVDRLMRRRDDVPQPKPLKPVLPRPERQGVPVRGGQ